MRLATLAALLLLPAALPSRGWGQGAAPDRAAPDPGRRAPLAPAPHRLPLALPPELQPFGLLAAGRPDAEGAARSWAEQLGERLALANRRALFGVPIAPADATGVTRALALPRPAGSSDGPQLADRAPGAPDPAADTLLVPRGALGDLDVDLQTRIETRGERLVDHRCVPGALNAPVAGCRTAISPTVNVQFSLKSLGTVAERFRVNVDFDSQREFDASNQLSVAYEGGEGSILRRLELGNVAFNTPSSRFLGAALPAGNYGFQAQAQLGRLSLQAIAAQQKGTVARERQVVIGERTLQGSEREIEDWQIEPRRFFFAVDPRRIPGYPAIDILDRARMTQIRAALPDTLRPTRLFVYRLQFGAAPQNPNGPRFRVQEEGVRQSGGEQTYDVLREGVDYYADPSLLWFALVRPLNETNERLVVAYTVRVGGRDTTWVTTGGTPDVERTDREQLATLVWDPNVTPASPAFAREIRSVYRIGGSDLVRERTQVRVVAGAGSQEKPLAGRSETYLQMFGLAQPTNSAEFDVEQRLWPRRGDPVFNLAAGAGAGAAGEAPRVLGDHFLVFPSLQPFAERRADGGGLVEVGNPANEAIYTTPGEYLAFGSPRHPASVYRLLVRTDVEGSPDRSTLMLGGVQLRRASERLVIDGIVLQRDVDYRVDYEIGQVTFLRPDTLFTRPRTVTVRYEENPLFAVTPTRLAGLTGELRFSRGQLGFVAVSQSQASTFNRPQLGFERAATTMAGITGSYSLPLAPLSRALARLPGATGAPARLDVQGELALSRPQSRENAQAYLESFEGEGGVQIPLASASWLLSSMPAYGRGPLFTRYSGLLTEERAAPLVWQSNVTGPAGNLLTFNLQQIDPQAQVVGLGGANETLLWLTLHSHRCGAVDGSNRCTWPRPTAPAGTRWRSLRTSLGAGGSDLTLAEQIEFWALVDTSSVGRGRNPTLVLDIGEVSENTLAFAPESLLVQRGSATQPDSLFGGRQRAGFDVLNSERDPFTRVFDASKNDRGLPGDRVDSLVVTDAPGAAPRIVRDLVLCRGNDRTARPIGDLRATCTAGNARLDEEDIDLDGALNVTAREDERLLRFVVDLSDPTRYARVGGAVRMVDTVDGRPTETSKHWVLVRVPVGAPDERIGDVLLRRARALRVTMISGRDLGEDPSTVALARMRFVASPWVKRATGAVAGVAGDRAAPGTVIVSVIGTADRDDARGLVYEPPPGVTDQPETVGGELQTGATQINERSLRILATGLEPYARAEAYHRFPAGQQNFMGYRELRLWARGRGNGWEPNGELQMFVRIGRDEHNFYLYRTRVNAGAGQSAWLPELRVDFGRFQALRARMERSYLLGTSADSLACTGADSALIAASGLPLGGAARRRAACEDGYMVYSVEPGVTPPNLAAVQELAVGIVRLPAPGAPPVLPSDTLELWVDDIRLARAVDDLGTAGHLAVDLVAGDLGGIRVAYTRRGASFRQLGEAPSFVDEGSLDVSTTVRLDRLLPRGFQLALPLTVTHTSVANDPTFLSRTDLRAGDIDGLRAPRTGVTTWQLAARRATPLAHPVLGPLVNNLVLSSTYVAGDTRSAYQDGRTRSLTVGVDYAVEGAPHAVRLPFTATPLRWTPSQIRITSALARGTDERDHYFKPAPSPDDLAQRTAADSRLWRTGTTVELKPVESLVARWDLFSLRDLRDYGREPTSDARLLDAAGGQLGFERERTMQLAIGAQPTVREWLRPRFDLTTSYGMLRDPNVRALQGVPVTAATLADGARDSRVDTLAAAMRDAFQLTPGTATSARAEADGALPRRLTASQSVMAGVALDLAGAIGARDSSARGLARVARLLSPLDLTYDRSLLSAFDGATFAPPLGFQLALGDAGAFRRVHGVAATAAGVTQTLGASATLALPLGASLASRARHVTNTSWTTRLDESQASVDGVQTIFPDATLRWSWRPAAANRSPLVTGASASLGYVASLAQVSLPALVADLPRDAAPDFRTTRVRTLPVSASVNWALGGLTTTAGLTRTTRTDSLPGSIARGLADELTVDAGRAFRLPPSWGTGLRNDIRARASWQESRSRTIVDDLLRGTQGRLHDNGRRAISLNADTDVSETLLFSLQGSHVLTTDRNLDRRISQLVLSAVMQVQFYGGK